MECAKGSANRVRVSSECTFASVGGVIFQKTVEARARLRDKVITNQHNLLCKRLLARAI